MHWLNLLILALAVVGHILLIRAAGDEAYHVRIPHWLQRACTPLVTLFMLLFPALAAPILAFSEPGLAEGGAWSDVPLGWRIYIGGCLAADAVGLVFLVAAIVMRRPAAVISQRAEVVDTAAELGTLPVVPGLKRWIARLPFNDVCRVEIVQTELRMPRLPPECDGLSILHISDLHLGSTNTPGYFERALRRAGPADIVAMTGDIIEDDSAMQWAESVLSLATGGIGRYFVLGNHDLYGDWRGIIDFLKRTGWTHLADPTTVQFRGRPLVLMGTDFPWMGKHVRPEQHRPLPDLSRVDPSLFQILLSHTPHNFPQARQAGIDLVLAGHLHGGQIRIPILGPARGGWYNGGLYNAGRTLMSVSRGLGQTNPIRFRCRPEISRLILRTASDRASCALPTAAVRCG